MKGLSKLVKAILAVIVIVAIAGVVFLFYRSPSGVECKSDTDCTYNCSCHPTSCVVKTTTCDKICDMSCQPGTLDCNQGSCICVNGKCSVRWG